MVEGEANVVESRGGEWTDQDFPTPQFYHVVTTNHEPFHVCGSQQDNSTACTPFNWNRGGGGGGAGIAMYAGERPAGAGGPGAGYRDPAAGSMALAKPCRSVAGHHAATIPTHARPRRSARPIAHAAPTASGTHAR